VIDVSVIVATQNRRQILPQAVNAILRQEGVAIELVVVNDGSTDETRPWLDRLAATDPRVKVAHHLQPRFAAGARNVGIACATGHWVAFCGDGDLWAPDKLATQLAALHVSSARWGCTGSVVVDECLQIVGHHHARGGLVLAALLKRNIIPTGSSVIVERRLVRLVGGFDRSLRDAEDWDLWIRLAQHSPLATIDRPLVADRLGRQSRAMRTALLPARGPVVAERYAALAANHALEPDEAGHEHDLARRSRRAAASARAASIFSALAFKRRQWRELPRTAAALVAPGMTDRIGQAGAAAAVPAAWREEAEGWLRPIREANQIAVQHHPAWVRARELEA
jgi:glycosyltransferase involved in cell wall biosynthesis